MLCNDGGGSLLMILPLMMIGRTKEKQAHYDDKERRGDKYKCSRGVDDSGGESTKAVAVMV